MILAITAVHLGDIAVTGLLIVGLALLFHLGRRVIDLWIESMRNPRRVRPSTVVLSPDPMPDDEIERLARGLGLMRLDTSLPGVRAGVIPAETSVETSGRHAQTDLMERLKIAEPEEVASDA